MDISEFKNVVWKEGEYYVAQSLNVDISSFGENKEQAVEALREALQLYFEDAETTDINEVSDPEFVTV